MASANNHGNNVNLNSMEVLDCGQQNLSQRSDTGGRKKYYVTRENSSSSLEFLPPEDDFQRRKNKKGFGKEESDSRPSSSSSNRAPSSSAHFHPSVQRPDSSSSRRTPTPTKQISLQAVRRKDEGDQSFEPLEWNQEEQCTVSHAASKKNSRRRERRHSAEKMKPRSAARSSLSEVDCNVARVSTAVESHLENVPESSLSKANPPDKGKSDDIGDSDAFDTDLEDEEGESDSEEEEVHKAPNELLMEFVTAVMTEDYTNAKKLCTMVLMYEPDNPEALKFQSLIDEKIRLDEEAANAETDSEEETDSDDDSDEDSDEDDSEEESSENTDESDEDSGPVTEERASHDPAQGSSSDLK